MTPCVDQGVGIGIPSDRGSDLPICHQKKVTKLTCVDAQYESADHDYILETILNYGELSEGDGLKADCTEL
jgi:hypothetical protein